MAVTSSINLDLLPNTQYEPTELFELAINTGDLSQLGLVRSNLKTALQWPLVNSFTIHFPSSQSHPVWRALFTGLNLAEGTKGIKLTMTTDATRDYRIGLTEEAWAKTISDLQEALDPTVNVSFVEIATDERVVAGIRAIESRLTIAQPTVLAWINEDLKTNPNLREWLVAAGHLKEETQTMAEGIEPELELRTFNAMDFKDFLILKSKLPEVPDELRSYFEAIDFQKLMEVAKDDESTYQHPAIRDVFNTVRAAFAVRHFRCPEHLVRMFTSLEVASQVTVAGFMYGDNFETPLIVREQKRALLSEFAFYFLSFKQINATTPQQARWFAQSRQLILRHGLFIESTEKTVFEAKTDVVVDLSEIDQWAVFLKAPEAAYASFYTTCHSFLQAGHHATAANLDLKHQKILGALGIAVSLDVARQMMAPLVYQGPHVASFRVLLAYCLWRLQREKVSNAIAVRLQPTPPLAVAYVNLEIFMDALHAARFFEALKRDHEYKEFKKSMAEIRSTMYYVAPYSFYLYGKTAPDPVFHKNNAAKLASYAAALKTALPGSTLVLSPALMKLADDQARNSIANQMLVEAYVAGFRRFFRVLVQNEMTKSFNIRVPALAE